VHHILELRKRKPMEGEVIAVGAGKRGEGELIPLTSKPGDPSSSQVQRYGNQTRGEEYLILREEEILAKLSGAAKAAESSSVPDVEAELQPG